MRNSTSIPFASRRARLLMLTLALLSISLVQFATTGPANSQQLAAANLRDCEIDGDRQRDQCIADSCGGVCTAAALQRCQRIGHGRFLACYEANAPAASMPPARPPKVKPVIGRVPTPAQSNPTTPKKPTVPGNVTAPKSNPTTPTNPKGPQQASPRPQSNPSPRGPVLR